MIGKLLGALIGNRVARSRGGGGVKGAVLGVAAERLVTRMGPLGWVLVGVIGLWRLLFGRRKPKGRYR